MFQIASISRWASLRLAVGSSVFITYLVFACGYWYSQLKQQQKPRMYLNMSDLASKMYLFGLGALLSLNYYQGSIYTAIFTYFNMTAIIVLVAANLISSVNESIMTKIYLVFYSLLFMWYMGIMIDYFTTWKSV